MKSQAVIVQSLDMYACMHVCMYACMDVWMYGCMDVWMYVCICRYVCIHINVTICLECSMSESSLEGPARLLELCRHAIRC